MINGWSIFRLGPDVATIGNHEVDYGLAHLLFLEKCANFPIINANFHIRSNHKRLFQPHYIAEIDGMKILFIGIITEDVLAQTKAEAGKNNCLKTSLTSLSSRSNATKPGGRTTRAKF